MFSRTFKGTRLKNVNYYLLTPTRLTNASSALHLKTGEAAVPNRAKHINCWNESLLQFRQQTRTMAANPTKLEIRTITKNDEDNVVEFLKKNFYADEPITKYVKLLENPASIKVLSKYSIQNIGQNISYLARSVNKDLAGVCLNSVKVRGDYEEEIEADPIFGKITGLLGYVDKDSKIFEKFPDIDKLLSVDIISVDNKFQGLGIGKLLMDKTRELARKQGIKLIRVDCTSHYSARASEKLGMECVYELKYKDYIVNGEQVFKPEPPHTGVKIYVQRLDS